MRGMPERSHSPDEISRLEKKIDLLADSIRGIGATLHAIQLDLEKRLAAIDVRQEVIEGVHRQLIVVGELQSGLRLVESNQEAQERRITRAVRDMKWAIGLAITVFGVVLAVMKLWSP